MVASFADGTKISFELTAAANGAGFRVARRGMLGPDFSGGNPGAPVVPPRGHGAGLHRGSGPGREPEASGLVDDVVSASPGP